jgi:NAD(P)-dependent dehydrogenase (short-subunit alcohol dehydrogenase family)
VHQASGIGLATAQAISQRPDWEVHILDLNPTQGEKVVSSMNNAAFHQVDVTDYAALGIVFRDVFRRHRRLDFVYANAGITERNNEFYQRGDAQGDEPPPLLKSTTLVVDVCLTAAAMTAYLAQHYFRLSPPETRGERNLVFTASCGALYPAYGAPIYTAAKHGVLGLMRAMAPMLWRDDGVRVNAVLPGTVKTNLLTAESWKQFPEEYFTPVEKIVEAVLIFVDGKDPSKPDIEVMQGNAIECSGDSHYYREQYPYCDEAMRNVMSSTDAQSRGY